MKKKMLIIVNPISGTKSKGDAPSLLNTYLDKDLFDYEICFTTHPGHATEMAHQAVQDHADIVVAVGGDGTVNEVARSLVNTPTALGIIPC
ncbi:MAG: diacylglycerol/lipid kinase family protein, partial [Prevotella sp.]